MSALSVALMYIRMAQTQLGEPLGAANKPEVFPTDPILNLDAALSLIESECDLIRRKRGQ